MPRAQCILQSDFPYNVTARCINKEWFALPMPLVWEIFSEELYMTHREHGLRIHSFILMSNHFHLIASTPNANISQCMHRFMHKTSIRLTEAGNRINQTFSGRHYKTILHRHTYFLNAYKYNYLNPVLAGLTKRVEDYPYSTLSGLLGRSPLLIPIYCDDVLFSDIEFCLQWLNLIPDIKKIEAVRYALKRQRFKSKKCRSTNRLVISENDTL